MASIGQPASQLGAALSDERVLLRLVVLAMPCLGGQPIGCSASVDVGLVGAKPGFEIGAGCVAGRGGAGVLFGGERSSIGLGSGVHGPRMVGSGLVCSCPIRGDAGVSVSSCPRRQLVGCHRYSDLTAWPPATSQSLSDAPAAASGPVFGRMTAIHRL